MPVLQGRVIDAHGVPVAGASVYVESESGSVQDIAAVTAADGAFAITVPVVGRYRIGASGSTGQVEVELEIGEAAASIDLRLLGAE